MPSAVLRIDPRPVAQVLATMLQAFRWAGPRSPPLPAPASAAYEHRADPGNSSPKAGLHLPAPVHPQTSAPAPGKHRAPIRAPGQGPATGLATGADTHPGSRPGDLGHPDRQPTGFPALGGKSLVAGSRSGLRLGSLAPVALRSGLAPVGGSVALPQARLRWSLERAVAVGPLEPWPGAEFTAQSRLCRSESCRVGFSLPRESYSVFTAH